MSHVVLPDCHTNLPRELYKRNSIGFIAGLFVSPAILRTFASSKNTHLKILIMAHVISEDCIACGTCIDECPVEAISEGDIYKIDPEICTDCGTCADVCPVEAIHPA
jgi:ferredoxin